ncbi:translation initiation factor 2 [Pseudomonas piscis]|uniref:translation initiation factor 2 n=1 Tax=Pseudomonas piscis TaxID=2614538 RepID=UPI0039A75F93
MKAFLPAIWLCACLLGAVAAMPVEAAAAVEKTAAGTTRTDHSTASGKAPAKKVPVKKAPASKTKASKTQPANKKPAPAKQSKWAYQDIKTPLVSPKLDLNLPTEMVKHLQPLGATPLPKRAPLLPPMFGEKPKESTPFQLNGRLLTNEMQLQLRREERRDIEGAALDFEFKQ